MAKWLLFCSVALTGKPAGAACPSSEDLFWIEFASKDLATEQTCNQKGCAWCLGEKERNFCSPSCEYGGYAWKENDRFLPQPLKTTALITSRALAMSTGVFGVKYRHNEFPYHWAEAEDMPKFSLTAKFVAFCFTMFTFIALVMVCVCPVERFPSADEFCGRDKELPLLPNRFEFQIPPRAPFPESQTLWKGYIMTQVSQDHPELAPDHPDGAPEEELFCRLNLEVQFEFFAGSHELSAKGFLTKANTSFRRAFSATQGRIDTLGGDDATHLMVTMEDAVHYRGDDSNRPAKDSLGAIVPCIFKLYGKIHGGAISGPAFVQSEALTVLPSEADFVLVPDGNELPAMRPFWEEEIVGAREPWWMVEHGEHSVEGEPSLPGDQGTSGTDHHKSPHRSTRAEEITLTRAGEIWTDQEAKHGVPPAFGAGTFPDGPRKLHPDSHEYAAEMDGVLVHLAATKGHELFQFLLVFSLFMFFGLWFMIALPSKTYRDNQENPFRLGTDCRSWNDMVWVACATPPSAILIPPFTLCSPLGCCCMAMGGTYFLVAAVSFAIVMAGFISGLMLALNADPLCGDYLYLFSVLMITWTGLLSGFVVLLKGVSSWIINRESKMLLPSERASAIEYMKSGQSVSDPNSREEEDSAEEYKEKFLA